MNDYNQNDEPYYIDTETCGLHGIITLIQYAKGNSDIHLHCPWNVPVKDTINLIETFVNHVDGVIFFNAVFDFFHLYKMYTIWKLLEQHKDCGPDGIPQNHISLIVDLEDIARDYSDCIKPVKCLDLFLHARKGPYQSTMDRKDIKIRKVPIAIAWMLAQELEIRIPFKDIYFARRKDSYKHKWELQDIKDTFGEIDPDFKNVIVRFAPSSALKALAVNALNIPETDILKYGDINPSVNPVEFGYCPVAKLAMKIKLKDKSKEKKRENWTYRKTWPDVIEQHISHWLYNETARLYAKNDIVYTRALRLHKDFISAEMGDDDSTLACAVACARWRGFSVDIEGIKLLKEKAIDRKYIITINRYGNIEKDLLPNAPRDVKRYILNACIDETERLAISSGDTAKITLENLAKDWTLVCDKCNGFDYNQCNHCKGKGVVQHPAGVRAQQILDARKGTKEIELYDKLLAAGRFHASVKIIGALSGRMSGADGLNPQGIKKTIEVKSQFIFFNSKDNTVLVGGDFAAFEITIAEAVYNDPNLRKDLLTCDKCRNEMVFNENKKDYFCVNCGSNKGLKIHALFGIDVFPDMTYEEIKATDGTEDDKYTRCKSALFALIYGSKGYSLVIKLGVSTEVAEEALRRFTRKYRGIGHAQQDIESRFGSMNQPGGRGKKVYWKEPEEKIATLFGFNRYFTLENRVCKELYNLANNMPKAMKDAGSKIKVTRTDREQFASGAACSAIYSAAFAIQSFNVRAAKNHVIQGSGSQVTKKVQRNICDIQPSGVHPWLVQTLNIHDSVMCVTHQDYVKKVDQVVSDTVESVRPIIPLIKMPWTSYLGNWADKYYPICSCELDENGEYTKIVHTYKDRKDVRKYGYSLKKVINSLVFVIDKKNLKLYKGLAWRFISDENELKDHSKRKTWRTN